MPISQERLDELLKEEKARAEIRSAAKVSKKKKPKIKGPEKKALNIWKEKRAIWTKYYTENPGYNAPAGEAANMLEGLTPDGFDKTGKKVSFVERGKGRHNIDMLGSARGITRFSDGRVERLSR